MPRRELHVCVIAWSDAAALKIRAGILYLCSCMSLALSMSLGGSIPSWEADRPLEEEEHTCKKCVNILYLDSLSMSSSLFIYRSLALCVSGGSVPPERPSDHRGNSRPMFKI